MYKYCEDGEWSSLLVSGPVVLVKLEGFHLCRIQVIGVIHQVLNAQDDLDPRGMMSR